MGKSKDLKKRVRRTQTQIKDDDAKAALALKKNTRPIAMLLQKKPKQQPKQQPQQQPKQQQRRKRRPHPPVFVNLREGIANSRGSSNSSGLFLSTRTSGSDKMALQALMPAYLASLLLARRHLQRLHKIRLLYFTGVL